MSLLNIRVGSFILSNHSMIQDEYIHCFKRAMQAISHSDALWKRYFIDFTHQRLNMVYYEDGISHPLMRAALGTYIQQSADR